MTAEFAGSYNEMMLQEVDPILKMVEPQITQSTTTRLFYQKFCKL